MARDAIMAVQLESALSLRSAVFDPLRRNLDDPMRRIANRAHTGHRPDARVSGAQTVHASPDQTS